MPGGNYRETTMRRIVAAAYCGVKLACSDLPKLGVEQPVNAAVDIHY
jgi:hypothetical protein